MNLAPLLYCCFLTPIVAGASAESVAIVDLRECFKHVPTAGADRAIIVRSVTETETEAKKRVEALKEAESLAARDGSTELQRANARLLKLEFEAYRHREQDRLRKTEQEMFIKWHKQVDTAVNIVAKRDGFTIVLYIGEEKNYTEVAVTELKQLLSRSHLGFVLDQDRTSITAKVVAEMSTAAFVDAIEQSNNKSEQ